MSLRYLLILAVLLAGPSWGADNDWDYPGCTAANRVGAGRICFDFSSALSPAFTTFQVTSDAALACLKPDVDQEGVPGAGTPATAVVRFCPYGSAGASATNEENCGVQACAPAGCTLTGLNGAPAAQLACVGLGPGNYRVDFPTLPDGSDIGLFSVEGSD